jgi:hypothetical protein
MAKRIKKKLPRDVNARAFAIGELATGGAESGEESAKAESGRKGGLKGGDARAASLTESQRKAIAKKAADARWKDSTK